MPNYCVVGGCKSTTNKSLGISTFAFPKDKKIRRAWVKFVQQTRLNFKEPPAGNTSSVVCSKHFEKECFVEIPVLECQLESGYRMNRPLKKDDAIPTILWPDRNESTPSENKAAKGRSGGAAKKRERKRVIQDAMDEYDAMHTPLPQSSAASLPLDTAGTLPLDTAQTRPLDTAETLPLDTAETLPLETAEVLPFEIAESATVPVETDTVPPARQEANQPPGPKHLARSKTVVIDIPPAERRNKSTNTPKVNFYVPPPPPSKRSKKVQCDIVGSVCVPSVSVTTTTTPTSATSASASASVTMMTPVSEHVPSASAMTTPVRVNTTPSAGAPRPLISSTPIAASTPRAKRRCIDESQDLDVSLTFKDSEQNDPTWEPNLSATDENNNQMEAAAPTEVPATNTMYAVSASQLLDLFKVCHKCGYLGAEGKVSKTEGTLIHVTQWCLECDEEWRWKSQGMVGNFPEGNIRLSMAILAAGAIPRKVIKVLDFWGVQAIAPSTYFSHQRKFLHQAVRNVWEEASVNAMASLGDVGKLAGDARCDSVGHCAKYGSYSLHDTQGDKVVLTELVQSTEVKSSYHMELEGLKRTLDELESYLPHLKVDLTTDGHTQIQKWLREEKAGKVNHYLDVWHVSKGLRKKMLKLSKRYPVVKKWIKSIINHLYWCAVSSNNDGNLMVAKWKSVVNHIANIHVHKDNQLFPRCIHGPVTGKEWLDPASEAYDKLCRTLLTTNVLKAVSKLSSDGQTSGLEGYHSTVLHFAPKMFHFGYNAMKSRLQLAALHFNENAGRGHAKNRDGSYRYNVRFPKNRFGECVVVPVMKQQTFGYVKKFAEEVRRLVLTGRAHRIPDAEPPSLCSAFARPKKADAVAARQALARRYKNMKLP